jgi:short-subunit dehydrogenase involved in D-alanine esterification of teichoic acids
MKLFRKRLSNQDEKVLVQARELASQRLKQYIDDRPNLLSVTKDAPKKSVLTRLRSW